MGLWRDIRPDDLALNLAVAPETGELVLYRIDDLSGRNTTSADVADRFVKNNPQFRVQDKVTIPAMTLNAIVAQHAGGRWPDFLSLDLEGLDYAALQAVDFSNGRPSVICLEWRDAEGGDGSAPFMPLLANQGYVSAFRTWGNIIAVRDDLLAALGLSRA